MRKITLALLLLLGLFCSLPAGAQYNKYYFYYIGRSFLIDNRYQDAVETLNILLKVDPKAHEGYFLRGVAKYNLDDLYGAESDFTRAIENNPVYTIAYQYRAIVRMRMGNYDDALRDFQEAIDLRPDLPGPYYSRGVTYLLSQQYDKAIEDFDQFIRQEKKVSDAYLNRGVSYLHLKDTVRALEDYNTGIKTNRENPNGYNRRGELYLSQEKDTEALWDFNKAVSCDTTYIVSYFNRALALSKLQRPMEAIADLDHVLGIDSTNSITYFNRALIRSQIGDYNRALDDYDKVIYYAPNNVAVYYNRAGIYTQLGDLEAAMQDYSKAIELYPDFANAYLGRSRLRYLLRDEKGSKADRNFAEKKIAEYRSKLSDTTFSIYADTALRFDKLMNFDSRTTGSQFEQITAQKDDITLLPLFRFTPAMPDSVIVIDPQRYYVPKVEDFIKESSIHGLRLVDYPSNIEPDSLVRFDQRIAAKQASGANDWLTLFQRGVSQASIRQYTASVNSYTEAIEKNPANPFLYLNRSTTRSEMIDFISSIGNSYQRINLDGGDPAAQLKNTAVRTYSYDEAIADLNKAIKLMPDWAHLYYNRGNLYALSGQLPEAYEEYSAAIKLNPNFAEAWFNRGLVQIFLKDTRKGCLDVSKAGELGIRDAYKILKRFSDYKY